MFKCNNRLVGCCSMACRTICPFSHYSPFCNHHIDTIKCQFYCYVQQKFYFDWISLQIACQTQQFAHKGFCFVFWNLHLKIIEKSHFVKQNVFSFCTTVNIPFVYKNFCPGISECHHQQFINSLVFGHFTIFYPSP